MVPLGKFFTFRLSYSTDILSLVFDGTEVPLDLEPREAKTCSFKLGNFNQAKSDVMSEVRVKDYSVRYSSARRLGQGRPSQALVRSVLSVLFTYSLTI